MGIFLFWIVMAIICGAVGANRKIGGLAGFFLGLFLSVIGLIIVLSSKSLEDDAREKALIQNISLHSPINQSVNSTADELQKLAELKANNAITDEEYNNLKSRLINS